MSKIIMEMLLDAARFGTLAIKVVIIARFLMYDILQMELTDYHHPEDMPMMMTRL